MGRLPPRKARRWIRAPKELRTWGGVVYDSKGEMLYAQQLDLLLSSGKIKAFAAKPDKVQLGVPEITYRADFMVTPLEGEPYYVDYKGKETREFMTKKRLWKKYGPAPLHIVKSSGKRFKTVEIVVKKVKP